MDELRIQLARTEERLDAEIRKATAAEARTAVAERRVAAANDREADAENRFHAEIITAARLEERLVAATASLVEERAEKEQARAEPAESVQQARAEAAESVLKARTEATYFASKGIELATKVVDMHGGWENSHDRSIETPPAGRKTPVVTLLNASGSEDVRNTHDLPPAQFPLVFKIVERQEGFHVKTELGKLCAGGCEKLVLLRYYANGITLVNMLFFY
ncbi:hypothetical protein DVH05_021890 [Phytophthora capsici]|nr:hypothetical protein DVH05_021890 [Phytophthora capsici]